MTVIDFNFALTQDQLEARQRRFTVDADDVRARIHGSARSFIEWLFSGRALIARGEARIGDVAGTPGGSLSISLTGASAGLWHDHSTGEGGDLIGLYQAYMGYGSANFQLALKEIAAEFLRDPIVVDRAQWQQPASVRIAEKKQRLGDKPRADMLELGPKVADWKYLDTNGKIIASVARYEPDGPDSKTYRPFCFKNDKWQMGAPPLRPLYRIPEIVLAGVVVLTEGEKCADALVSLGIVATTAMQGAHAPVDKTDWSPIHGKKVIIWPDNDAPGIDYARRAAQHLKTFGCDVSLIQIPYGKPDKWDAANCVAEGGDPRGIIGTAIVPEPAVPRIRLINISEFGSIPLPRFLIDRFLPDEGVAVLWGQPGSYKSFVAIDMALCAVSGLPWHGNRIITPGPVVYIAAEGFRGIIKRVAGWRLKNPEAEISRFWAINRDIKLCSDNAELIASIGAAVPAMPRLIVVDTLAKTIEGSDRDDEVMNKYTAAAYALTRAFSCCVMLVHHAGKNEELGERGASNLRGNVDFSMQCKRKGIEQLTIKQVKVKDFEELEITLRTVKTTIETNDPENPIETTLVLLADESSLIRPAGQSENSPENLSEPKLGQIEKSILRALKDAGTPVGFTRLKLMTNAANSSVAKALKGLSEKGLVGEIGDPQNRLWVIK